MRPVSVVIPYRPDGGWRDKLFTWVLDRYNRLLPDDCEVIVGKEADPTGFFCRADAANEGARRAENSILLIADADAVFYLDALEKAILNLEGHGAVIPYNLYHELDEGSTRKILSYARYSDPDDLAVPKATYPESNASLLLVTAENYWGVGGFDERFVAWGPEDQALYAALTTIYGPAYRVTSRDVYHLWHPITTGHRTDNPHYSEAMRLWRRYQSASNAAEMREVLAR